MTTNKKTASAEKHRISGDNGTIRKSMMRKCSLLAIATVLSFSAVAEEANLELTSQPLGTMLNEVAAQFDKQVVFFSEDLEGVQGPNLVGDFHEKEALNLLLADTGLEYRYINKSTIAVGSAERLNTTERSVTPETNPASDNSAQQDLETSSPQSSTPEESGNETAIVEPVTEEDTSEEADLVQDAIVVRGRARDAELAIEAKRNADQIVDVLSADAASRLPDQNIAEALGRIPGVSFQRNGQSGNGDFISVRGLDSALVNVQFNGVNSGLGEGGNRRVPLDGVSSDDIAEIRVTKSLLPQDEGEGIGASINITQNTPLLRGEDQYRLNANVRPQEFSDSVGYEVGGRFNKVWGDKFGIGVAASFRRRFVDSFLLNGNSTNIGVLSALTDANGNPVDLQALADALPDLDPGDSFDDFPDGVLPLDSIVFEDNEIEYNDRREDQLTISGAIDWRPAPHTLLTLGGRFSERDAQAAEYGITFDEDDGDFLTDDDGNLLGGIFQTEFGDTEIEVDNQLRDVLDVNASAFLKGVTELDQFTFKYQASYARAERDDPVTDLFFDTDGFLDDLSFQPFAPSGNFFFTPNPAVFNAPEFIQAVTDFGGTQNIDDFTVELIDNQTNDRYAGRFDAEYRPEWDFGGILVNNITLGAKYERSEIRQLTVTLVDNEEDQLNLDGTFAPNEDGTAEDATLGDFPGLFQGLESTSSINDPFAPFGLFGIPRVNDAAFRQLSETFIESFLASGEDPENTEFLNSDEDIYAAYVQTEIEIGKLTLIGGVRVEHYEANFEAPLEFDGDIEFQDAVGGADMELDIGDDVISDIFQSSSSNTEVLPRLSAIYRVNDQFQIRGGAGLSLARPTFSQLGQATEIDINIEAETGGVIGPLSLDQVQDAEISIETGNPNLDNAESLNLDLSFEYFPFQGTALTLGLFYKDIDNFIFIGSEPGNANIEGLDAAGIQALLSPDNAALLAGVGGLQGLVDAGLADFEFSAPSNGDSATIKGIELGLFHQFTWAPGILADMGMFANVTLTDSDASFPVGEALDADEDAAVPLGFAQAGDFIIRETTFFNSPDVTANASIFYEANGLEAALSASYQSEQFDADDDFGFDQFSGRFFQLDLFLGYELPWKEYGEYEIFFEVADITDSGTKVTDLNTVGRARQLFDEGSFNGREFQLGLRARF